MNGLYDQLPVSKIQSLDAKASLSTILAEKMEFLESMLEGVEGEMVTCEIVNEMGSSTTRLKLSTRIHHSRFISRRSLICRIGSISDWLRLHKAQKLLTLSLCNRTLRKIKPYHSPLELEEQMVSLKNHHWRKNWKEEVKCKHC